MEKTQREKDEDFLKELEEKSRNTIPYTLNTSEVRSYLMSKGYKPLSFFQGKKYVYPLISTCGNFNTIWKEKDYSTFDLDKKESFLYKEECSFEEFKIELEKLESIKLL